MSKPQTFLWLPQNKQAFCQSQDLENAGTLIFNGDQVTSALAGVARTLSLTSDHDLSGVEITCAGILNGQSVSQKIKGPNKNTVETTQIFQVLTSVDASDAAHNISVGTGTTGQTDWVLFDYQRTFIALSTQVVILDGTATYSLIGTLSDPVLHTDMIPRMFPLGNDWKEQTKSALAPALLFPLRYACVQILESDETAALEITLLQQGVA